MKLSPPINQLQNKLKQEPGKMKQKQKLTYCS